MTKTKENTLAVTKTTTLTVTLAKEAEQQEESAASKQDTETGIAIGVSAGVVVCVVIAVIGVVVAIVLRRKKMASVKPHTPHIESTSARDKQEAIELTTGSAHQSNDAVAVEGTIVDHEVVVQGTAVVEPAPQTAPSPQVTAPPKSWTEYTGTGGNASLTLGQRVLVHGFQAGVIMYIGELEGMPMMTGMPYIGIKLDEPDGSSDGTVQGVRYFQCDAFCSVFVTPQAVQPAVAS